MIVVPPGGFAGMAQMTQASRAAWTKGRGRATTRKRSRKKSAKRTVRRAAKRVGRKMLNGRRMTAKQAKYFGKKRRK